MTVHDLSFLVNPSWFSKPYYYLYKVATPLALRTSKHIITVSQFSKKEIVRFYPFISPDRISVVYNAVNTSIFHVLPKRHSSDTPYFLAVSSIDQRKNFLQLLNVFDGIQGCTLKIVGGNNRKFNSSMPERNTPNNIEYLGRVSDAELVELYNEANAFIFPSLYEGFGLPPLNPWHQDVRCWLLTYLFSERCVAMQPYILTRETHQVSKMPSCNVCK